MVSELNRVELEYVIALLVNLGSALTFLLHLQEMKFVLI